MRRPEKIDCNLATAPCFGQDAFYATLGVGCPHDEFRFDIDEAGTPGTTQLLQLDDTVTDNCTGLMWQRETADITGDGVVNTFSSNADEPDWQGALQYCDTLDFGGSRTGGFRTSVSSSVSTNGATKRGTMRLELAAHPSTPSLGRAGRLRPPRPFPGRRLWSNRAALARTALK